ncbi:hypothetical protein MSG28_013813 [Choristoneura fumiferana]|uniref:Uncharacterized protein n=1 Tax=Choristoneura fumiferana TaxID=7141 RepID=A0ACC0K9I8_CHOFU|nr:hypothetical protein MSG28_013813 [Choristoneura fumiferana]
MCCHTKNSRGSQHDLNRERSVSPDYYGSRRYSRVSPGRETPDRHLPHYGPRFPPRGRFTTSFYLQFLKFMNHKKSRLTDLFRKMDKDNNGLIPRNDPQLKSAARQTPKAAVRAWCQIPY